ncbi:DMT family transporter [Alicyclobacillus vulcanalis]|uniref:Putative multidrug resistance efflux transporter n=1 Tax=Alicyclobacillus vulcanalis TaxID=252246 RepID=A0A1N7PBG9_9BACL|nr:multidrug resistance efflux transporter family protein [Alicyclobacillus vulcanalis]SIT07983.1 Putative multidrug resistance efflux transporter [Alicyclobacillus vulcanalis]
MTSCAAIKTARWRLYFLGLLASLFFAVTFVANEAIALSGGSWLWNAPLRYFFTLPFLFAYVLWKRRAAILLRAVARDFARWMAYGTVGFGLFYAPLCLANAYGPAWLVAGVWQITIVCGALLTPWVSARLPDGRRPPVPRRELVTSAGIVAGALLLEMAGASHMSWVQAALCAGAILVAAVAYPAGNRMAMRAYAGTFDPLERMLGMTLGSLPFWFACSAAGAVSAGWPSARQLLGALLVAVCSGVIATALFFRATDLAHGSPRDLAVVEATQAGEVVFALLLELCVIPGDHVSWLGAMGLATVVAGLCVHGFALAGGSHRGTP